MYAYIITCQPDIGYVINTMRKVSPKPSQAPYDLLKGIVLYLRCNKTIRYQVQTLC